MEGIVHSIESLSAVDGEGLRCTIFMAGCPLRCSFCHNPDTWQMQGTSYSAQTLVKKILRFRPYFGENGGVTFSGGEPLLQAAFLRDVVDILKMENIHFVLDTSGQVQLTEDVLFLMKNAQSVLLDLKFWDDPSYRAHTGQGIQKTLDFFGALETLGTKTIARTVVIPEVNDTLEHIKSYVEILDGFSCVKFYELLPFHTMGFFKYEKLGIKNPFQEKKAMSSEKLYELQKYANNIRKNG